MSARSERAGRGSRGQDARGPSDRARGLTPVAAPSYDPGARFEPRASRKSMATFGETLRRERELRQVTLREVAEATKINVRYLEALERDDFEYLPGGAFNKGFIRAYARYIGVDDAEMIDAYLYEIAQQGRVDDAGPAVELDRLRGHVGTGPGREALRRRRAQIAVIVSGLVLLAALVVAAWWGARLLLDRASDTPAPAAQERPAS